MPFYSTTRVIACAASLVLAVFLAPSHSAHAQASMPTETARQFGSEQSAPGLDAVIATQSSPLLQAYGDRFQNTAYKQREVLKLPAQPLPAAIEALIVKHYDHPEMGEGLRLLIANGSVYQTRALFERMEADWKSSKTKRRRGSLSEQILRTNLSGLEPRLLALLALPLDSDRNAAANLAAHLSRRQYLPAIPVLARLGKDLPPNSSLASVYYSNLAGFRTRESMDAIVQRMLWLRTQPASTNPDQEYYYLFSSVLNAPADLPIDEAALKRSLPVPLGERFTPLWIGMLNHRKMTRYAEDAVPLLLDMKHYPRAMEVVLNSGL